MLNSLIASCQLRLAKVATAVALMSILGTTAFAQDIAIKDGKIITVTGETIEKGTVLIRDGRIAAVGADVKIPVEAKIVNAAGKVVMPGFVEAHSSDGMSQSNETNPNVPYLSVLDSIDPMRSYFDEARRNGVTTVAVVPGNSTMIGGQGAVIKTGGTFLDDMILKRVAGMKISLSPVGGSSRMGHLAALRKELTEAKELNAPKKEDEKETSEKKDGENEQPETGDQDQSKEGKRGARRGRRPVEGDSETPKGGDKPAEESKEQDDNKGADKKEEDKKVEKKKSDEEMELEKAMMQLVSGEMLAFIHCESASDIENALSLIKEFGLKPILVLGKDCYKAASEIAATGFPVILDSELVFFETDPRTKIDKKIVVTEAFRKHNTTVTYQVARPNTDTLGTNYLWYQAATAVRYGTTREDALKALTIVPAKMLGIDQYVGSLEKGKDGDVIVLTGDPLEVDTWVDTTIVNGKVVYERANDPKLQLLLEGAK